VNGSIDHGGNFRGAQVRANRQGPKAREGQRHGGVFALFAVLSSSRAPPWHFAGRWVSEGTPEVFSREMGTLGGELF